MENNRFPCRDTNASRRALSHVRSSQDHQFSPFLASVTKAIAFKKKKKKMQALLNPLFSWLVSISTHKSLAMTAIVSPLTSRSWEIDKQCLQKWKEKDAAEWRRRTPGRAGQRDLRLGPPAQGLQRQSGCAEGHHYHPSTRAGSFPKWHPHVVIRNGKQPCG